MPWFFVLGVDAAMFTGPAYEPSPATAHEQAESSRLGL